MAKFIRYALAGFFFAASIGCLALCYDSLTHKHRHYHASSAYRVLVTDIFAHRGNVDVICYKAERLDRMPSWSYFVRDDYDGDFSFLESEWQDSFGLDDGAIHFPIWYPALVFALAGVGVLRFRRQFSIRSAMIGLAVVAVLLGMVLAL